ncbi:hypothetical protein [Hymenobacter sp.]|uniref:hypothetical protein n=1 Tax=Hymenobacter sp. TaxID=1898978 RepID=UPI00286C10AB|nr:hypothetical protein [Hymenobacter sp.]
MDFYDKTYPIPGWLLRIDESSNDAYRVSLTDQNHRRVELCCSGHDLPTKVQECVEWAEKLNAEDRAGKRGNARE